MGSTSWYGVVTRVPLVGGSVGRYDVVILYETSEELSYYIIVEQCFGPDLFGGRGDIYYWDLCHGTKPNPIP